MNLICILLYMTQLGPVAPPGGTDLELYVYAGTPCLGISGARVSLPDLGRHSSTNSEGYTKLPDIPPGTYLLRVAGPGGERAETLITFSAGSDSPLVAWVDLGEFTIELIRRDPHVPEQPDESFPAEASTH